MCRVTKTRAIENGESIDVYNNGYIRRDFTYIDDIVEGIIRIQDVIPQKIMIGQ
jgi:UDP-glucuronate 4-epimerase